MIHALVKSNLERKGFISPYSPSTREARTSAGYSPSTREARAVTQGRGLCSMINKNSEDIGVQPEAEK